MNKLYLVTYSTGSYDDYFEVKVFATANKDIATKWIDRFNSILNKWKEYYKQYENTNTQPGYEWIEDKYVDLYFDRWYMSRKLNKAFFEEIELRN